MSGGRGAERWEANFAPEPDAARRARLMLETALRDAGVAEASISDALLILGELVINAMWHARTDFTVWTTKRGSVLRVEVFDRDTRPPALMGLDAESTSGRGLHIVAAVADDWGWNTAEEGNGVSGKVVWAELALDAERPDGFGERGARPDGVAGAGGGTNTAQGEAEA